MKKAHWILGKEQLSTLIVVTGLLFITTLTRAADPVGFWRFEEGSSTTAADETANGNNGTLIDMDTDNCWVDILDFAKINQDWLDCGILNLPAECLLVQ